MKQQPYHDQVRTENGAVDGNIAPLLHALWLNGFDTFASCENWSEVQEDHAAIEMAYIKFCCASDANRFTAELEPPYTVFRRLFVHFPAEQITSVTELWESRCATR